jgi:hypothetical protein
MLADALHVWCLSSVVHMQDLRRARMVLWVDDPATVYTNNTAPFFDAFADYISIKRFDYNKVGGHDEREGKR